MENFRDDDDDDDDDNDDDDDDGGGGGDDGSIGGDGDGNGDGDRKSYVSISKNLDIILDDRWEYPVEICLVSGLTY